MLLNLQQSLIDRVLAHLAARTTDLAPSERKVPVENYFSSKRFELEQRSIFQQRPVVAALSAMLQRPGDFSALDLGGVPVLLSRDRQGKVHAHVNACRHRGTKLVWQAQGSDMHTFTCPYHAWSYSNDGALLGIPHWHCFPNLKKNERDGSRALHRLRHRGQSARRLHPEILLPRQSHADALGHIEHCDMPIH